MVQSDVASDGSKDAMRFVCHSGEAENPVEVASSPSW